MVKPENATRTHLHWCLCIQCTPTIFALALKMCADVFSQPQQTHWWEQQKKNAAFSLAFEFQAFIH